MRQGTLAVLVIFAILAAGCAGWFSGSEMDEQTPGPATPAQTLPTSLHGTSGGMQWWYEQDDGAGQLFGITYADTGCGNCHIATCDQCHTNGLTAEGVDEPTVCTVCHSRLLKEEQLGVTDLHFAAGMVCSDCHSAGDMHGDGTTYNSMLESPNASCEDCHAKGASAVDVPDTQAHTVHGDILSCDACHMSSAVTCYNCHFDTLLTTHEKKPAGAFKDFIFLLNDDNGKVRAGTYQSVVYDGKTFIAFGPFHGHSVVAEGRGCADCHGNERIQELNANGEIVVTQWNEAESKIEHTTGAIPFIPDKLVFQFLDFDGTNWLPTTTVLDQLQYEFCTPLTADQLDALGYSEGGTSTNPAALLPTSLHGTARGMQWWYEQSDGAGQLFGVDYASTGCGNCHIESCGQCHANADGTGEVDQPDVCTVCHSRLLKEEQLGVTDLHFEAGMVCSDCHSLGDMHGDGLLYNSMLESPNAECENCHAKGASAADVPDTQPHNVHGDALSCDACHMSSAVTCYNCHFDTLLTTHEKKPAGAFKDFIFLLNDADGQVRAGTYQSVVYDGKTFIAFGPFHGHSVVAEGRDCADCHNNARIQELSDTGEIIVTQWNAGESKIEHTTGAIPFVPDALRFQFVDFDGTNWSPLSTTINQLQYKFSTPLTADQLSALGYVEGGYSFAGAAVCENCHAEVYAEWADTGHAEIEEIIQTNGQGGIASCRECHDVGYEAGGFVDYETTPQFANVQCENCHGTGLGHPANGALPVSLDAALCGACHTDAHHPTYDEWQASGHATFDVTGHEATGASCVRCHTGDWFLRVTIFGEDPPAEDLDPEVNPGMHIVCAACHDPHNSSNEHQLRISPTADVVLPFGDTAVNGGNGNLCITCHNGRRSESDRDGQVVSGSGHFGPHPNAQGAILFGVSAVEFDGAYTTNHMHQNLENTCVTCHMRAKDFEDEAPAITGHEFAPVWEACIGCHTDVATVQQLVDDLEAEVQTLLDKFVANWPAAWKDVSDPANPVLYNMPDTADPPTYDGPPVDDAVGNAYRECLWNYLLVLEDGSSAVHNPAYVIDFMTATNAKLNELNGS